MNSNKCYLAILLIILVLVSIILVIEISNQLNSYNDDAGTLTEEVTEAPTEEVTEAPTEEVTEASTEEVTEASTEEVPVVEGGNPADYAPDGKKWGISEEGILYQARYYDEYYGHAADNVGKCLEDIKPYYYKNIDLSSVYFPSTISSAHDFPALVLFDLIEYVQIPEYAMRKYLPSTTVNFYLELEEYGPGGDQGIAWERTPAPEYLDIYARKDGQVNGNTSYKVTYTTSAGSYTKYVTIVDGKAYDTNYLG